ncbi:MAG: Flp pilus assembly complex ATPase component TadA [Gemmatimonadetes bacterium]|nr:Flp pilus assembly complex ATPase component TadA [Gemmatimonadota bacterium]
MSTIIRPTHWIVGVARRADFLGAAALETPVGTTLAEAWRSVMEGCAVDGDTLAARVAAHFRVSVADLARAEPAARKLIPESLVRKHFIFPISADDRSITVATADPTDMQMEQDVAFAAGRTVRCQVAAPVAIHNMIEATYSPEQTIEQMLRGVEDAGNGLRVVDEEELAAENQVSADEAHSGPVVQLVNLVLQRAIERNTSDIHLQPAGTQGVVRYRIDGVLVNSGQMPLPALNRVISRIKVMAKLDIADRLRPQDGRARVIVHGRTYDLRISTIPARGAEKCVIRLLDTQRAVPLSQVGLLEPELVRVKRLLAHRDGIVVVTGPTGSGKTTTLYAALQEIHGPDINIMTVEDPIEFELPGVTQIQVETKQGVTFASALRAILRQDPDVIFVGEIRDAETAAMAAQAALTGHLVLATLHTNDAPGAIRRLADLGLDPATIASTLRGAVAQRLVRRVNGAVSEPIGPDDVLTDDEARLARVFNVRPIVRVASGEGAREAGYRGRMPLAQVFEVTPEIADLIANGATIGAIEAAAVTHGMRSLRASGVDRVATGETTLQELERVLGDGEERAPEAAADARPASAASAPGEAPAARPSVALTPSTDPAITRGTIALAADRVLAALGEDTRHDASPHVLVVDDDGANRMIARALLMSEKFEVTEATDGAEALALLRTGAMFDLVVLDLDMPKVNGREVLHALRADVASAGIPTIILTGTSDAELESSLLDEGADDYIRKPFDPRRFLGRVKATLRRSRG